MEDEIIKKNQENHDENHDENVNIVNHIEREEDNEFEEVRNSFAEIVDECGKILVGQNEIIELMIIALICDGHVLLEGVPGVAKTLAAKTFSKTINADFSRIQFTPDLMPSDIIGTSLFNMKEGTFNFKKGPIFSNIILIDEINRAPAKTQSALFEVMEEKQISYDGATYLMTEPFMVIATQNPVEQEGTYRLPEAQLDRFLLKINFNYLSAEEEVRILHRFKSKQSKADLSIINAIIDQDKISYLKHKSHEVHISDQLIEYIIAIIQETRINQDIYLGASPRAALALMKTSVAIAMINGRNFLIPDDIQAMAPSVICHRMVLTPEAEVLGKTQQSVLAEIIKSIEVPR